MKTAQIQNMFFVLMMILICGGISWLATMELRKENELRQKEIDHLKKQNAKELDSLNTQLAITRDSLLLAQQTIILQADTLEANKKEKENYKRNTHDKIKFIPYANDSQRDSVLSGLYPSFRSFR